MLNLSSLRWQADSTIVDMKGLAVARAAYPLPLPSPSRLLKSLSCMRLRGLRKAKFVQGNGLLVNMYNEGGYVPPSALRQVHLGIAVAKFVTAIDLRLNLSRHKTCRQQKSHAGGRGFCHCGCS